MQEKGFRELLHDESFINYCFRRNETDIKLWESRIRESPEEHDAFESAKQLVLELGIASGRDKAEIAYLRLRQQIAVKASPQPVKRLWHTHFIKYAAVAVLLLSTGIFFYKNQFQNSKNKQKNTAIIHAILPGSNKAVLTLSDGSKHDLGNEPNGKVFQQAGLKLIKTADGQLLYHKSAPVQSSQQVRTEVLYNTIHTPRSGQYQVTLPDGSRAWLNAVSSLRYPLHFDANERRVEMTGEVYFEIEKDAHKPFYVKTSKQEVMVLGTHFNINAYPDEALVRTTLLEGSVKVNSLKDKTSVLLKPGQRADLGTTFLIHPAGNEDIAWKNGDFIFKEENLPSIMRKLSRWYDITVICPETFSDRKFDGIISRSRPLSAVLHRIESTGKVHFKIEGRRITLMN